MTIILFFTFIYMFLDDKNFSGLNIIQELLKEELLKEKVNVEIKNKIFEGMTNLNSYNDNKYNDKTIFHYHYDFVHRLKNQDENFYSLSFCDV